MTNRCKKFGQSKSDVQTVLKASRIENIRNLYGQSIARELVPLKGESKELEATLEGLVTNANYNMKKSTFILFINNRLVQSSYVVSPISPPHSGYHCFTNC
jgi:DNA mismatch repair protein MLH1